MPGLFSDYSEREGSAISHGYGTCDTPEDMAALCDAIRENEQRFTLNSTGATSVVLSRTWLQETELPMQFLIKSLDGLTRLAKEVIETIFIPDLRFMHDFVHKLGAQIANPILRTRNLKAFGGFVLISSPYLLISHSKNLRDKNIPPEKAFEAHFAPFGIGEPRNSRQDKLIVMLLGVTDLLRMISYFKENEVSQTHIIFSTTNKDFLKWIAETFPLTEIDETPLYMINLEELVCQEVEVLALLNERIVPTCLRLEIDERIARVKAISTMLKQSCFYR